MWPMRWQKRQLKEFQRLQKQIRRLLEKAEVSTVPSGPNTKKNTILGCLLGFVLVAGLIIVKHLMNDNIRTEEDIERVLGLKTLVVIPMEKASRRQRTASGLNE